MAVEVPGEWAERDYLTIAIGLLNQGGQFCAVIIDPTPGSSEIGVVGTEPNPPDGFYTIMRGSEADAVFPYMKQALEKRLADLGGPTDVALPKSGLTKPEPKTEPAPRLKPGPKPRTRR